MAGISPFSLAILNSAEIEDIHEASLNILSETGVIIDSEEARLILQSRGVKLDGKRVHYPRGIIEESLKLCPDSFLLKARNPEKSVKIGHGSLVMEPARGTVFIADKLGKRRKASSSDVINIMKLIQTSEVLSLSSAAAAIPSDLAVEAMPAFAFISSVLYTDKPLPGITFNAGPTRECLDLAEIVFDGREKNVMLGTVSPTTPLTYDTNELDAMLLYARSGQPLCITPCAMAGTSGPPTLAGMLALNNAEVLAGITLVQVLNPGNPVVYGNLSSITDMRYVVMATGAPEGSLLQLSARQMAGYYGLPFRGGGALNDAKTIDYQAGCESMLSLMVTMLAGFDYIPHAVGVMDSYMSTSYEKFILDEEMVQGIKRLIQGITVNEQTMMTDLISRVGPGGNFLISEETATTFRQEYWRPHLAERQPQPSWEASGSPDLADRAMSSCQERFFRYQKPGISSRMENELLKYFRNRYGRSELLLPI